MPELPEVEAIRRVIEPQIQGRAVERVTVRRPEVITRPSADEFCRRARFVFERTAALSSSPGVF